jgi:hypothetical protein
VTWGETVHSKGIDPPRPADGTGRGILYTYG